MSRSLPFQESEISDAINQMLSDDIVEIQTDSNTNEMYFAAVNEQNVKKF